MEERGLYYFERTSKPMIKAAKTLKSHLSNILTYFKHGITNFVTEGLNSKIQTVKQIACGFRNREHYRTAILFHCGGLDLYARALSGTTASLNSTICSMAHAKL